MKYPFVAVLLGHAAASTTPGHESCFECAASSGVAIALPLPLRVLLLLEALNSWPSTSAWSLCCEDMMSPALVRCGVLRY